MLPAEKVGYGSLTCQRYKSATLATNSVSASPLKLGSYK